jgi:fructose-specific phosphotransferase system IIC component
MTFSELIANVSKPSVLQAYEAWSAWWGVIMPLFCIVAIVGNLIAMVVFHHRKMRSLSTLFIISLLGFQFTFLITMVIVISPVVWLASWTYPWPEILEQPDAE